MSFIGVNMTRNEAILILRNKIWYYINGISEYEEALKIAINSLEIDEEYNLQYEQSERRQNEQQEQKFGI